MWTSRSRTRLASSLLGLTLAATACGGGDGGAAAAASPSRSLAPSPEPSPSPSPTPLAVSDQELTSADVVLYTGEAPQGFDNGGFGFAEANVSTPGPTIRAPAGAPLTLVLQNISVEVIPHDVAVVAEQDEASAPLWGSQTATIDPGESTLVTFTPEAPGRYFYICTLIGHMSGHGMWGRFVVE